MGKKNTQIFEIGENEKFKVFKSNPELQNECETYNEGYYKMLSKLNNYFL